MKTVIVLMDFYGHPTLNTDTYTDNIRYSALSEIFSKVDINKNECIFFSTYIPLNAWKLHELRKIAANSGFRFVCPNNNITTNIIIQPILLCRVCSFDCLFISYFLLFSFLNTPRRLRT